MEDRLVPPLRGYPHDPCARSRHASPFARRLIRMERRIGRLFP